MKTLLCGVRELMRASEKVRSADDNFPTLPSGTEVEVNSCGRLRLLGVGDNKFALDVMSARDLFREMAKDRGIELKFVAGKIEI